MRLLASCLQALSAGDYRSSADASVARADGVALLLLLTSASDAEIQQDFRVLNRGAEA
jgi:hypothetical protein